ncbi:dienelactone hydrolase family protein [Rhodovibrionaceae bacterium A322]
MHIRRRPHRSCFTCLALLVTLWLQVDMASAGSPDIQELRNLYRYDKTAPLQVKSELMEQESGEAYRLFDLQYGLAGETPVSAYLVEPTGSGPHPAVVFLHWGFGNRSQFLEEAITLAEHRIASLLITSPYKDSAQRFIDTVVRVQQAVDLLSQRPGIDGNRLAYVGHSWGATTGGILAGVERRFATLILMAGTPDYFKWAKEEGDGRLNAFHYLPYAAPAPVLLQFASKDAYVSEKSARLYRDATSEPKETRWYDARHDLDVPEARQDRQAWLIEKLR